MNYCIYIVPSFIDMCDRANEYCYIFRKGYRTGGTTKNQRRELNIIIEICKCIKVIHFRLLIVASIETEKTERRSRIIKIGLMDNVDMEELSLTKWQ